MTTTTKLHMTALVEVFELILIASVIALLADTAWLMHDVCSNGISVTYAFILGGLTAATIITMIACVKHHRNNYRKLSKELLAEKLKKQKHINHHRRTHK